jgi:hypothetical protein
VEHVAIDLDDESGPSPQEVDLVAADADVDLGPRQPRSGHEGDEAVFGLGAGHRRLVPAQDLRQNRAATAPVPGALESGKQLRPSCEAADLGLIDGAGEIALPEQPGEIDDRPRRARDGNPVPDAHIASVAAADRCTRRRGRDEEPPRRIVTCTSPS